ncbi:MAG: indolepyruvate oxidoreductase subunit beta [Christensenellaceae bacterium]|nr:indolepyruvate oxidoreductase subunit beta [Christensenellaceae bacterium]
MNKNINIVIVGVGGQGILLASKILGKLAIKNNLDVKVSEVHGMAQRGGSVITHVRIGQNIFTPMVAEGTADYIVSLELLETVRAIHFLKDDGIVITSIEKIDPTPVKIGKVSYPENPLENIKNANIIEIEAPKLAIEAGNKKSVNVVLLGALSKYLPFSTEEWLLAIEESVRPYTFEINKKAFLLGKN